MYHQSPFGSKYAVCFGQIKDYDGARGTIVTRFGDGSLQQAILLREYVVPRLPPSLNLCIGLEVQYEHHFPINGAQPYAYNVRVLTPLPWDSQQHNLPAANHNSAYVQHTGHAPTAGYGYRGPAQQENRHVNAPYPATATSSQPPAKSSNHTVHNSTVGLNPPAPRQLGPLPTATDPLEATACAPTISCEHTRRPPEASKKIQDTTHRGWWPTTSHFINPTSRKQSTTAVIDKPALGIQSQSVQLPGPPPLPPGRPPPLPSGPPLPPLPGQPLVLPGPPPLPAAAQRPLPPPLGPPGPPCRTSRWGPALDLTGDDNGVTKSSQPHSSSSHGPQRAPQPPVPYNPINLPYLSQAAHVPLPGRAAPSRWPEPAPRREDHHNLPHHHHRGRHQRGPQQSHHDKSRKDSRRRHSPPPRRGLVHVADPRHRAAAVAAATVRHRRRSLAATDLPPAERAASTQLPDREEYSTTRHESRSGGVAVQVPAAGRVEHPKPTPGVSGAASNGVPAAPSVIREPSSPTRTSSNLTTSSDGEIDLTQSPAEGAPDSKDSDSDKDVAGPRTSSLRSRGVRKSGTKSKSSSKGKARKTKSAGAAPTAAADLGKALADMKLNANVVSDKFMRLFCGHCGKEQKWDVKSERAKPLTDPTAADGLKRTRDGMRVLYDAQNSACEHCGAMVMCNPLSAVCNYCDTILTGFRPTYWKCNNRVGTAVRRTMPKAAAAPSASSNTSASAHPTTSSNSDASGCKSEALRQPRAGPTEGCEYSHTCHMCVDYDLRYRHRPPCNCKRFHGAIAGQITGNKAGNVGWAMVH